ncbi:hypothetical protein [Pseudopontixanthobacter vadosimaris]|uniref:hypothetical protein n=1 Tax=Pseudopontixanthobacter vadosimaris TaxID=2726450 RepID=UPI0014727268|nr:hypothetical protein [Pseudopontixanthobacter vadosimaris]
MSDDMRITNFPDAGSVERVALDLASKIGAFEKGVPKSREYWLDLYEECHHVVRNGFRREKASF